MIQPVLFKNYPCHLRILCLKNGVAPGRFFGNGEGKSEQLIVSLLLRC